MALFIDSALRKHLDINADTVLRVTTDGARLVIEPCGVDEKKKKPVANPWDRPQFVNASGGTTSEERRAEYYARAVLRELCKRGLNEEHMLRLHHRLLCPDAYNQFLCSGALFADEHDYLDMRRLEVCLQHVSGGMAWDQAISASLDSVPMTEVRPCRSRKHCPPSGPPHDRRG